MDPKNQRWGSHGRVRFLPAPPDWKQVIHSVSNNHNDQKFRNAFMNAARLTEKSSLSSGSDNERQRSAFRDLHRRTVVTGKRDLHQGFWMKWIDWSQFPLVQLYVTKYETR